SSARSRFGNLAPFWCFSRRLFLCPRPVVTGNASDRHRGRFSDPYLFGRLYVGRRRLLPLLQLHEPFHVFHADACPRQQLLAHVCRLGGRRPRVISPDRILLPPRLRSSRRKESI